MIVLDVTIPFPHPPPLEENRILGIQPIHTITEAHFILSLVPFMGQLEKNF